MMQRHMPLGYKIVDGKVIVDEEKAAVPKKIFEEYHKGCTSAG
ncbi:hypothetical protein RBU61_04995 [Tissierella sp. MB52-C2]|nr:hypothetical protein [Tissierella sp. MB52-C2]WMM26034.1 hypothetical protein RBU61_04995 [Tissierella sp. MB52-C2]